nr:digestive organ expansion factor [Hymenolepis microstoma]
MIKNNARAEKSGLDDSLRDQGFHRVKVLIILPTREAARRTVHQFLRLMPKGSTVSHRKRFEEDFGPQSGHINRKGKKPPDYEEWFSCNSDDRFRIGIAIAKKSVKLYTAFAESDIVISSPLGLETLMAEKDDKLVDMQYITTSVELLVIDQAEHLLMQNWATVQEVVGQLNQRPIKPSLSSPARIRLAYLAGYGSRYRQTLLFSAVNNYLITALMSKCENFQGMNIFFPMPQYQSDNLFSGYLPENHRVPGLKRCSETETEFAKPITALDNFRLQLITFGVNGSLLNSNPLAELTKRLDQPDDSDDEENVGVKRARMQDSNNSIVLKTCSTPYNLSDKGGRAIPIARLAAFKHRILPRLRKGLDERVLIYVPDYYDFEELRKLLREEALSFCYVHEYIEDSEAERNRHLFDQGRIRIMLLSERYYFYRRRKIRGARNFIFYGPPTFPWFVRELLASCKLAPAAATNASGESLTVASANPSDVLSSSVTILYFQPWEAAQVSMITASIDV